MSTVRIKTASGIKEVSRERLTALMAAGKIPRDRRIVTTDNGLTWCTAEDAIGHPVGTSAPVAPMPQVASVVPPAGPVSDVRPGPSVLVVISFVLSGLSLILVCLSGIPAIICAAVAMGQPNQRRLARTALFVAIGMTVITTLGWGIVARLNPDEVDASDSGRTATTAGTGRSGSTSSTARSADEPESQSDFVQIVREAANRYRSARNEIGEAASRDARRRSLQARFSSSSVDGWVGRITSISTNLDGLGVLSVSIGPDITLATWNNELSDIGSNSLIAKSSPIYQTLMNLDVGDRVIVSGRFVPSQEDHFEEQSLTLPGSMLDPAFTFVFRSLETAR